ncbi:hypothetical protein [Streptomyces tendae]|uniref:hypothetical protein n=1 Tax=Streptomyces tendae TaxID=1932 RepID=UPI0024914320|nr:hypothetical protein [Streptomyces tendae]
MGDTFRGARREAHRAGSSKGRSKQELAFEAVREAQDRAELRVDDVMVELMDGDAEILHYLK